MRKYVLILLLLLVGEIAEAQQLTRVYLIPGQGSDYRIYNNIQFDEQFDTIHIHYITPLPLESMTAYAKRLSVQIDTTTPFYIIGVSLGGMIACELTDIIKPEKVIIISSADNATEIPELYHFFSNYPLHAIIPSSVFKYSTFIMQPLYEPDRKLERSICNAMIWDKDGIFIKRATAMIVGWNRTAEANQGKNIIQIHGDLDHTIPIGNVKADYVIEGGSHMMTLTKGNEVTAIINTTLLK